MTAPLLSVIIPTHNRPQYLPRAVESALQAAPNGNVEVIVVPNGGDETWKESLATLLKDKRIIVSPIEKGHANAARNHGMKLAQGKYIRFLDDDDFFYPYAARKQLEILIERDADISFGQITKTDGAGNILEIAQQQDTDDFIEAAIGRGHSTQPGALVVKRSASNDCIWDESINKNQDVYWAWQLCKMQELKSFRFKQPVAAWVQHLDGIRVSRGHHRGFVAKETTIHLLSLLDALRQRRNLNSARVKAIADSLWGCIHDGIMFQPMYWVRISLIARELSTKSYPDSKMYNFKFFQKGNPLIFELMLIPWRWLRVFLGKKYIN